MMKPEYERAAIAAAETLIKYNVRTAPVAPLPILKSMPGVFVISYADLSQETGQSRQCVISMFGDKAQDAFTSVNIVNGKPQYLVTYNALLSVNLFQRALARELGHIVLGHDGSLPEDVRYEEAKCFANHLLCPRAMIRSLQETHMRLTKEALGNLTGCYDHCLSCMRRLPAVHVPAELNRKVKEQFMPYVMNFFSFQQFASLSDGSALADFGTYMEGYVE